jgi:hypothetical protein
LEPLADFLGVAQVIVPNSLSTWQSRSNFLPLVTTGQQPRFAGPTETLQAIARDDFKPRREVYLPTTARVEVRATNAADARITSPQWAAQRVRFSVEATAPAMVVIAQSFYHNWRAMVDGHPARLWRANHAFQALEVPAGRQEVTLVYQDMAFFLGAIISGLTLITCLVMLVRASGPRVRPPAGLDLMPSLRDEQSPKLVAAQPGTALQTPAASRRVWPQISAVLPTNLPGKRQVCYSLPRAGSKSN